MEITCKWYYLISRLSSSLNLRVSKHKQLLFRIEIKLYILNETKTGAFNKIILLKIFNVISMHISSYFMFAWSGGLGKIASLPLLRGGGRGSEPHGPLVYFQPDHAMLTIYIPRELIRWHRIKMFVRRGYHSQNSLQNLNSLKSRDLELNESLLL